MQIKWILLYRLYKMKIFVKKLFENLHIPKKCVFYTMICKQQKNTEVCFLSLGTKNEFYTQMGTRNYVIPFLLVDFVFVFSFNVLWYVCLYTVYSGGGLFVFIFLLVYNLTLLFTRCGYSSPAPPIVISVSFHTRFPFFYLIQPILAVTLPQ